MKKRSFRGFVTVWKGMFETKETRVACLEDILYMIGATIVFVGVGWTGAYGVTNATGWMWGCSAGLTVVGMIGGLVCGIGGIEKWYDLKSFEEWKKFDEMTKYDD